MLEVFGYVADLFELADPDMHYTNPFLDASHSRRHIHCIGVQYEPPRVSKDRRVAAITQEDIPSSVVGSCRIYWDPLCVTETLARGE
jgi:hypothetical protein